MTVTTAPAGTVSEPLSRNHRRLDESGTRHVTRLAAARGVACRCGEPEFDVGDALEMGSIWPDEELGAHLVALRCPRCGAREGIRISAAELPDGLAP